MYDFKKEMYDHQKIEFEKYRKEPARALLWQMRTGKTKAIIDLACSLWHDCEIDTVVVVAPNFVHIKWGVEQLPEHMWDSVPYINFVWSSSNIDNKKFNLICNTNNKLRWFIINNEALAYEKSRAFFSTFFKTCNNILLVVDEIHEFRWATSKRAKALQAIAWHKKTLYKRILSANPLDNSPLHAFAEFSILDKKALGFDNFKAFKNNYAIEEDLWIPGNRKSNGEKGQARKMKAVVGFKNQEELRGKIAKWSSLVTRDEVKELSELIQNTLYFELTDIQKEMYNVMVKGILTRLDNGAFIKPEEGGVLSIRLQQLISGFITDDEGRVINFVEEKDNARLKTLVDFARKCDDKAIIWCKFRHDVEKIMETLKLKKIKAVDYYGKTSISSRLNNSRAFKTDPSCRFLVGQYQAGGQGLDFSEASHIIWYSPTADLLKKKQADERASKMGGKKVVVTSLIAKNSIDEKILECLENRVEMSNFMTGHGLREYFTSIT